MFTFNVIHIVFIIFFNIPVCTSSYDAVMGDAKMPGAYDAMAVGYDLNNDTILLFGAYSFPRQFLTFKDDDFIKKAGY